MSSQVRPTIGEVVDDCRMVLTCPELDEASMNGVTSSGLDRRDMVSIICSHTHSPDAGCGCAQKIDPNTLTSYAEEVGL
ncbi:MAG: hypothetical protein Q8P66_02325 [Candidatus Colwellbacteria bacterium]|nr:hypothetical protein [Candidatus Colwellbacteria bacterium]